MLVVKDDILEIGIDNWERLYILPDRMRFQYIYRSATEVHWDDNIGVLYSPKPREWSYLDWYKHMINVVQTEYEIDLKLTKNTRWVNIAPNLQDQIMHL